MFVVDTYPYNVQGFQTFKSTEVDGVIEALGVGLEEEAILRHELALPMSHWGTFRGDPTVSHIRWICHPQTKVDPKTQRQVATGPDVFKLGSKAVYPKIVLAYRSRVDARRRSQYGKAQW